MKKLLLLLTITLCFCSCKTPQQKIAYLSEKYNLKQWEKVTFRDTIIIEPRTYIFQTEIDTAGFFQQTINGIELYGNVTDTIVTVRVVTDFDTIYIEKPIEIETIKVQQVEKSRGFFDKLTNLFFILFLLGFGGFIIFKIWK